MKHTCTDCKACKQEHRENMMLFLSKPISTELFRAWTKNDKNEKPYKRSRKMKRK